MKDLFSLDSRRYQQARPIYPQAMLQHLLSYVHTRDLAWDCGAGSGQLTHMLAPYFEQVVGTDISQSQLDHAEYYDNISYQVQPAEKTTFPDHCFDLITVAQAVHWFDLEDFYAEVKRTLKPRGIFAIIGYGLIEVDDPLFHMQIQQLYHHTLRGHWDPERRYIDQHYRTIPFPFQEIQMPNFDIRLRWSFKQLIQYLGTWSAVQHYILRKGTDPLQELNAACADLNQIVEVRFPVLLRVGVQVR